MRTFAEIDKDFPEVSYPLKANFTVYFGYATGKALGCYASRQEAIDAGAATVEKCLDESAFRAAEQLYRDNEAAKSHVWHSELRCEYSQLNDATFNAIYSYAYDRGHSYGMDEVASHMIELENLAEMIIKANKD